jgi:hypothetical protein
MADNSEKEKQETIRLMKDAKKYNEETVAAIGSGDDSEFTDYQYDVAINWLQRQAGIKQ